MLIDIDQIVVGNRIRKDFGDIEELAKDINNNGLINPITINANNVLLAGERRLRACQALGWTQVEAHVIDTRDKTHDFDIEASENVRRRNFTGSELAEGIRRQMEIESRKAKERMRSGDTVLQTYKGKARDKAGAAFGISGSHAEKVLFVEDHHDLLDQSDYADWNNGKLSTNKAYSYIKKALQEENRNETSLDPIMSVTVNRIRKNGWKTDEVRRLMPNERGLKHEPCFICGKHAGITVIHHVVPASELTMYLNVGWISAEEVSSPTVWLCPNCHTYVHAALDCKFDVVEPMKSDDKWNERFEIIWNERYRYLTEELKIFGDKKWSIDEGVIDAN